MSSYWVLLASSDHVSFTLEPNTYIQPEMHNTACIMHFWYKPLQENVRIVYIISMYYNNDTLLL